MANIGKKDVHLPMEFCNVNGVPENIREDGRQMRNVLNSIKMTPEEKIVQIKEMCEELFQSPSLKEWGITLDVKPYEVESTLLQLPDIIGFNNRQIPAEASQMKQFPIAKSKDLLKGRWIFAYGANNYN
jgi:hypothetical protein